MDRDEQRRQARYAIDSIRDACAGPLTDAIDALEVTATPTTLLGDLVDARRTLITLANDIAVLWG